MRSPLPLRDFGRRVRINSDDQQQPHNVEARQGMIDPSGVFGSPILPGTPPGIVVTHTKVCERGRRLRAQSR